MILLIQQFGLLYDLSTLSIPNSGDYFVTVDGSDMAGNVYSNASGVQDGNETAVDRITFTYYNPPTVILTHNHPDNILIESDTFTVTATFSHAMTSTPALSFSGLITDALMNNSGDPAVWSYSIDLSSLTIPSNGDYFITVGVTILLEIHTPMPLVLKMGMKPKWTESPLHITNHLLLF